jgi:glutamine synthetase
LTKDLLWGNANALYRLNLPPPNVEVSQETLVKALPWRSVTESSANVIHPYDKPVFDRFMEENPTVQFIYVQWLDYMGTMRTRILPIDQFTDLIRSGGRIGISRGNTGTLQNDTSTPAVNATGQIYVEPDLSTLRKAHKRDSIPAAMCMAFWRDEEGLPIPECPRGCLHALTRSLSSFHGISFLVGFEIEVTFLKRSSNDAGTPFTPLTQTHAWGTFTPEQWMQLPFFVDIITSLSDIGISIQQFHAEAGAGQYEFVLPPFPPLQAVDTLVQARQTIQQIAALYGYRATLHPQPFPGIGTAAHAHISMKPPNKEIDFWVGGVLQQIRSICAFSLPEAVSYDRVVDDHWTGGTWVAWGTQNRETPLRKISPGRWEVRCLDGIANMYLAISAIFAAGSVGLTTPIDLAKAEMDTASKFPLHQFMSVTTRLTG